MEETVFTDCGKYVFLSFLSYLSLELHTFSDLLATLQLPDKTCILYLDTTGLTSSRATLGLSIFHFYVSFKL